MKLRIFYIFYHTNSCKNPVVTVKNSNNQYLSRNNLSLYKWFRGSVFKVTNYHILRFLGTLTSRYTYLCSTIQYGLPRNVFLNVNKIRDFQPLCPVSMLLCRTEASLWCYQCDQIWRNFTTFAEFLSESLWQKIERIFGT